MKREATANNARGAVIAVDPVIVTVAIATGQSRNAKSKLVNDASDRRRCRVFEYVIGRVHRDIDGDIDHAPMMLAKQADRLSDFLGSPVAEVRSFGCRRARAHDLLRPAPELSLTQRWFRLERWDACDCLRGRH